MKALDSKHALKYGKGYDLKITIKKNKKGYSLYAKKNIKKGNTIAYYRFMVYDADTHKGVKRNMYSMTVYTKSGKTSEKFIGDVFEGSLDVPRRNIPYWAYFSNEPSPTQDSNCHLDIDLKKNYRNRSRVKAGDTMVYKLVSDRDIKKGEEITWCYGEYYNRNYKSSCSNE